MRLPLAGNISTKDGASNKNARMVNVLTEEKQGKTIAAVRPCLNYHSTVAGNGNGITCFDGTLVNVFGSSIGVPTGDVVELSETLSTIPGYLIFHGVELGNGFFVLCDGTYTGTGEPGNIFTTTNFSSYTKKLTDYTYALGRMIGNGAIAICSYQDEESNVGIITVNSAGTTTLTATAALSPICYGNGVFVATASGYTFATSTNGTTWSNGTYSYSYIDPTAFFDLQWNGSVYCMFYRVTSNNFLYARTSTNLVNWSAPVAIFDTSTAGGAGKLCVTTARNYFVVVVGNTVARSDNGLNWKIYHPFEYDFYSYGVSYNINVNKLCAFGHAWGTGEFHARYFSFNGGQTWFPDSGGYLTQEYDLYTGAVPYQNDFVTFRNEATNNAQVLTGVGFGITNISAIEDNPVDFAFIP